MQDIDPWQSFKAERAEPEEESAVGKILMTIFFIIIATATGALLGFFSYLYPIRVGLLNYKGNDAIFFVFVIGGAVIGGMATAIFMIRTFKQK